MNLGAFHDLVRSAIKRGSSLDALIPLWVSQAARVLEQNYTFSWMTRTTTVTFAAGSVPLEHTMSGLVKQVDWVKPILDQPGDGTEWYGTPLRGIEEVDLLGISRGNPAGFWLTGADGVYKLCFDAIPVDQYKVKVKQSVFTDWPTAEASTPVLLLRGEMCLFAQTLILFANQQRDPRMAETYGGILQGALGTLLRSEEELKLSHQNDLKQEYQGLR